MPTRFRSWGPVNKNNGTDIKDPQAQETIEMSPSVAIVQSKEMERSHDKKENHQDDGGSGSNENITPLDRHQTDQDKSEECISGARFRHLMGELKSLHKLQQEASHAQMAAETESRRVKWAREDIGNSDAAFMKELQFLQSQGLLEGCVSLAKLADQCKSARDVIGPLEEKRSRLEAEWYGTLWEMEEAQKAFFAEFASEFESAESYSSVSSSESSTIDYETTPRDDNSAFEKRTPPITQLRVNRSVPSSTKMSAPTPGRYHDVADLVISTSASAPGLMTSLLDQSQYEQSLASYSDPEEMVKDLDLLPESTPAQETSSSSAIDGHHPSIELYPELLIDFGTKRDRINKWLLHTTLLTRMEARLLREQLNLESPAHPSDWAQLVIAYYELDGASKGGDIHLASSSPPQYSPLDPWDVNKMIVEMSRERRPP